MNGDCNICINGKLPSYSASCVECGLLRKNYKPMTNADRIRGMTDEELAEWICDISDCPYCPGKEFNCRLEESGIMTGALDWLKAPVEETKK